MCQSPNYVQFDSSNIYIWDRGFESYISILRIKQLFNDKYILKVNRTVVRIQPHRIIFRTKSIVEITNGGWLKKSRGNHHSIAVCPPAKGQRLSAPPSRRRSRHFLSSRPRPPVRHLAYTHLLQPSFSKPFLSVLHSTLINPISSHLILYNSDNAWLPLFGVFKHNKLKTVVFHCLIYTKRTYYCKGDVSMNWTMWFVQSYKTNHTLVYL